MISAAAFSGAENARFFQPEAQFCTPGLFITLDRREMLKFVRKFVGVLFEQHFHAEPSREPTLLRAMRSNGVEYGHAHENAAEIVKVVHPKHMWTA